jgi:ribonuclease BN (tRNA processing enzyme)
MDIRVLGAHNGETNTHSCVSLLIDKKLAVEAGGLTSHLTMEEQENIEALLITHIHMDHIRDIPNMALNSYCRKTSFDLYSTAHVCRSIKDHVLNADIFPEFQNIPEQKPTVCFMEMEPLGLQWIDGHAVMPVPVKHGADAVGFQISDRKDKTVFFTGDTGAGLAGCWEHVSPELLIIDVTMRSEYEEFARNTEHLTPRLLEAELVNFRDLKGYIPSVMAIHMDAAQESDIQAELDAVKERLQADITIAHEGMSIII